MRQRTVVGLVLLACIVGVLFLNVGGAATATGDVQQQQNELRLVSPDGLTSITLVAENGGFAGIFVNDVRSGDYATMYVNPREGATVGASNLHTTSKQHGLAMALNSRADEVQIMRDKGAKWLLDPDEKPANPQNE